MATNINRREVLTGMLMSMPAAAAVMTGLADADPFDPMAAPGHGNGSDKKPRMAITISKETTYITEPLDEDGYPDYVAALNQRCSRGVTPENNAAVLFWKAMGPAGIPTERREKHAKMLGMARLPEKGDYYRSSDKFAAAEASKNKENEESVEALLNNPFYNQMELAEARPWSREEFPRLAEWLDANERPMTLLAEASRRPRRFDPWFPDKGDFSIFLDLETVSCYRNVVHAFHIRAMQRTHEKKTAEAWSDLMVCHRLARLFGQGATLVESLLAVTLEDMAQAGDRALLHFGKPNSDQTAKMLREWSSLPPVFDLVTVQDVGERFFFLSCAVTYARLPVADRNARIVKLETFGLLGDEESIAKPILDVLGDAEIDWDTVLRLGNSWCDRLVEVYRKPLQAERQAAIADMEKELKVMEASVKDVQSLKKLTGDRLRKVGSEQIAKVFVLRFCESLLSCPNTMTKLFSMRTELTKTAFALSQYRLAHGGYPRKLAELAPQYLPQVPKDIFQNDAELHYQRQPEGYLIYSVGPNGRDDGGKNGYKSGEEPCDDMVVQMPPAKQ